MIDSLFSNLQKRIGSSIILNLCKYDLMLPCPVKIVVKFGVTLIFCFSLLFWGKKIWSLRLCLCHPIPSATVLYCSLLTPSSLNSSETCCSTLDVPVVRCLLGEVVRQFIALVPSMRLDPAKGYFPLHLLHLPHFPSNFFDNVCVVLPIFQRVQCY